MWLVTEKAFLDLGQRLLICGSRKISYLDNTTEHPELSAELGKWSKEINSQDWR